MKKLILTCSLILLSITTNGCIKSDTMDGINIYTSVYPIEYITNTLYGKHANITSIYPDGIDINNYRLTEKQVNDYSKSDLFIYNGLSYEKEYAVSMINQNRKIKIIDAAMGMEYTSSIEEIWLNPSNLLMLSQNIKNGFNEYISNHYLKKEINNNYEQLKLEISELDAEIKLTVENATYNTIVVSNDLFKYLEKYDLTVISLEENDNLTEKTIVDVKNLISNNQIKYIYMIEGEQPNNTIQDIINTTNATIIIFNTISNISETDRNNKEDYISLTKKNLELLKQELYK